MKQNNNDNGRKSGGSEKHRVTNDQGSKKGEIHRKPGFPGVVDTVAPPSKKPDSGGGNSEQC
ncbi:hypothetical protein LOY38_09190 [Pseudomonas sp. B21-015]|uniref:hypothetical protein n=1 Tax=Pseudomonas sp. B21-015 TaxID=2895473 RepID=UPI00216034B4|nr:hypothetical protein [Pseudomonas sp. B21-015]UVM52190.1 hypothetical protein LOY38_09190 [Pseudomonas sp. B21-015]